MAMNNHNEARRKAMFLDRACEARKRLTLAREDCEQAGLPTSDPSKVETVMCTDQGQFYQTRNTLTPYRVTRDGHDNRYRGRQHLAPHCDRVYEIIYPSRKNAEYTEMESRLNRRENSFVDNYEITKKVNGEFEMQVSNASKDD